MKKLLLLCILGIGEMALAQTNIFPSSGNVGIGTTNPDYPFHIKKDAGNGDLESTIENTNSGSGARTRLNFQGLASPAVLILSSSTATTDPNSFLIDNVNLAPIKFLVGDVERMRLTPSGNIGIGTTNPSTKLEVSGNHIKVKSVSGGSSYIVDGNNGNSQLSLLRNGTSEWAMGTQVGESSQNFNVYNYGTASIPFTINKASNNVGIGTASPSSQLEVRKDYDGGTFIISQNTNNSTSAYAGFAGKVQNHAVQLTALSDGLSRAYPGFHASSTMLYGSSSNGLNIISDVGTGSIGPNTGVIRFITCATSGGVTSLSSGNDALTRMIINASGNIGIGTSTPAEKLSVNGKIRAKEIKVETSGWSDFVFEPSYKLPDLKQTEVFIKENKHLPDIPSAKEVAENGINLGEMNSKLLQKIEELTLYIIDQNKRIEKLEAGIK